jgi:aubergine-like protein
VPEFCRETGLNDELRAGGFMMKLLKAKPRQDERIRKYSQFLTRVFADAKDLFERYNIRLKGGRPSMLALDGGRMPPGKISFGGTQHDLAQKSMFDREAQGGVFSAPNAFKWAILSLQGDQENVRAKETFVREFQSACQRSRLAVSEPVVQELPRNAQQWLQAMRDLRQADFLLLVVPARGRKKDDLNLYKLTKRLAIAELAVPTQVVLSKTLTGKGVTSIVSKVLTQVVAKLNNGAPWGLVQPECTDAPTMVCGVDVWHGQGKSIMGFTASLDQNFSK